MTKLLRGLYLAQWKWLMRMILCGFKPRPDNDNELNKLREKIWNHER